MTKTIQALDARSNELSSLDARSNELSSLYAAAVRRGDVATARRIAAADREVRRQITEMLRDSY